MSPDPFPEETIFIRSDQYSFVQQGVPAVFLDLGLKSLDPSRHANAASTVEPRRFLRKEIRAPTRPKSRDRRFLSVQGNPDKGALRATSAMRRLRLIRRRPRGSPILRDVRRWEEGP